MNQRLKSWESPRKEGRNDKGKGGSARQRQKRKQFQMLRKKLKGEGVNASSLFYCKTIAGFFDMPCGMTVNRRSLETPKL